MKTKEFLEFLIRSDTPPVSLKNAVGTDIRLSFRCREIILKFLSFQFLGALITLSFCPQFGLGLVNGHGLTHVLRLIGEWACAAFCGSLFLSAGLFVAFLGMKGEELWWIWRRYKFTLIFLPTILWSLLMIINLSLKLPQESALYHLTWIVAAILAQALLLKLRSFTFEIMSLSRK